MKYGSFEDEHNLVLVWWRHLLHLRCKWLRRIGQSLVALLFTILRLGQASGECQ